MKATAFLSVRMPETEGRRVKVLAASLGLSLQEVVRQALDAWVLEHDPRARRRRERQAGTPAAAGAKQPKRQAEHAAGARIAPQVAAGAGAAEPAAAARGARPRNLSWLKDAERLDWSQCPVVKVRATQAGRTWFFRGTHVPLPAVLHDFSNGCSLREVLARHAGLTAEQAKAAVQFAYQALAHTKNG